MGPKNQINDLENRTREIQLGLPSLIAAGAVYALVIIGGIIVPGKIYLDNATARLTADVRTAIIRSEENLTREIKEWKRSISQPYVPPDPQTKKDYQVR